MTYRSILLLLDESPLCSARTDAAVRLSKQLDCHLVGVAPTGLINLPTSAETASPLANYAALAWDRLRDRAERATERFKETCHTSALKSFEAVVDESDRAQSMVRHSHCSDLCVLTQADPTAPDHAMTRDLVEKVVLNSARPVLMLPWSTQPDVIGKQVMVAWDDSREAARAVADALPLLQRADKVRVVCWNEEKEAPSHVKQPLNRRLDALSQWLLWHGVSAEMSLEQPTAPIADAMLSRAAELSADLIVMGGYGHTRWSEQLMGGATRGLLTSMTVPVLMSH